jgi:hypothetical protein
LRRSLIALCLLGFFIGCPFAVFDFPHFWGDGKNSGFAYELLVHPKQGHGEVFLETGNGWVYHLFFNAPFLLGLPLLLAALFGMATTKFAPRRETSVLLIWCALYFFALGFSHVRFMRYLLPLAPALCVFAAAGVLALRDTTRRYVTGVGLVFIAAWGARDVLYPLVVTDPRDAAAQWMAQNDRSNLGPRHMSTPPSVGMIEPPWFFSPPLSPLDSPPFRPLSPSQLSQLSGDKYQFVFTGFDAAKLNVAHFDWFIISEFEIREKLRLSDSRPFMEALDNATALAARCKNVAPLALPGRDFVPHDFLYTNPEISIYRRN